MTHFNVDYPGFYLPDSSRRQVNLLDSDLVQRAFLQNVPRSTGMNGLVL